MVTRNYEKLTYAKLGLLLSAYVLVGVGFGIQLSVWFPQTVPYAFLIFYPFVAISAICLNSFAPVIKKK